MSSETEDQDKILLRLAPHLTAKLDALCQFYDMDRTHMLRRCITDGWEKMMEKKAQDALIQQGMKIAYELGAKQAPIAQASLDVERISGHTHEVHGGPGESSHARHQRKKDVHKKTRS